MTTCHHPARALAAACVVAVSLLGACGAGSSSAAPSGARLVAHSADATVAARTARVTLSVHVAANGSDAEILHGQGEESFADGSSDLFTGTPLSQLQDGAPDLLTEIRVPRVGETYESPAPALVTLPAGKRWVLITPADTGVSAGATSTFGSGDPASGLEFLRGVVGQPRNVGSERIGDETTTRYRVHVDLDRVLQAIAKGAARISPEFRTQIEALRRQVDTSDLPGEVWLDRAGRVRRFDYSLTVHGPRGAATVSARIEFSDFGDAVHVTAPPASEVVPFAAVADQFRRIPQRAAALGASGATDAS